MGILDGKTGLVTGAAQGIGRATAIAFAREGARVTVADRDAEGGRETVRAIEKSGGEALFVKTDVADDEQVAALVARTVETFGGLHCASNNAASGAGHHRTAELPRKVWDRTIAVTLTGVWLCMRHEIPAMLASGGGSIVNISSNSGLKGEAFLPAYSAAKGGVVSLTKTAASEYAEQGIRVNAVSPGGILTAGIASYFERVPEHRQRTVDVHAMKRLGAPEEVAEAVVWLCSDRSSFTTGHVLVVDGGNLIKSHEL